MFDLDRIIHCAGPMESAPCGRYVTLDRAMRSHDKGGWHYVGDARYACPRCARFSAKIKLRAAATLSGKPPSEWSDAERAAVEEVLGHPLPPRPKQDWEA